MTWKLDCGAYTLFVIEDGYYWRDTEPYDERATEHDWRFHPKNDAAQAPPQLRVLCDHQRGPDDHGRCPALERSHRMGWSPG